MSGPRRRSALLARLADRPGGSAQSVILDELRTIILHGEVPPGSAIPVDAVATAFKVSRIPVREALMTLIGEGLVDHRPNGGYRVAMLTAREFGEIYLVREALESAALRAAVAGATDEDDGQARNALRALDAAIETDDSGAAYHRESRRFHLALIGACRMGRLLHMLESAWNMTEPLRPMSHLTAADRELLHSDHAGMLAAFLRRDEQALALVCAAHHHRLQDFISDLPQHTGLFAEE
ncbi:DNA-binding GntR family transcriptional regulator [Actinoplanes lutulentus]|uniref:GntR family transcriptional regulator n=1 Tax=Actinoplanes lutulentus TaxID=1287878 RepID=A0A327ZCT5_9ACTN|nr:GntR family transcriptional regulator [Actinoplanes lutulentus]MBB2941530.1 DNA-binding GntR family transcriptional regulator [Actinoplanes lutulentus]RAK37020.1 GntR family transcriptional regulator [Actinoplanes lutulentus]